MCVCMHMCVCVCNVSDFWNAHQGNYNPALPLLVIQSPGSVEWLLQILTYYKKAFKPKCQSYDGRHLCAGYYCPNWRISPKMAKTNKAPAAPVRGPG